VAIDLLIDQSPETIEVNWTHTFAIRNREFEITAYADRSVQVLPGYPSQEIHAAMKRIKKRFSPEQLSMIHVRPEKQDAPPPSA
jgi:hypothetical protein